MFYKYVDEKNEHLHLLSADGIDWKPLTGTSTIGNEVLAKNLTWWAVFCALAELGYVKQKEKINDKYIETPYQKRLEAMVHRYNEIRLMGLEDWITLLDKAYKAHATTSNKAKTKGTNLHLELESFVKGEMKKQAHLLTYSPKIQPFIDWSRKYVKRFIASEFHCYSERLWCGGIGDFLAELNEIKLDTGTIADGTIVLGDFKSSKECYLNQFTQTGGYAIQVSENGLFDATGKHNLKLDKSIGALMVVPFGAEKLEPEKYIKCNVKDFEKGFECTAYLYKLLGFCE